MTTVKIGNETVNCAQELLRAVKLINNQLYADYQQSEEHRLGADLYTITIIGVFASIIILLMFRSIRPNENSDDQVVMMLASMQMRVDVEESARRKKKMREAKKRAQEWIRDVRTTGVRALSRRGSRKISRTTADLTEVQSHASVTKKDSAFQYSPKTQSLIAEPITSTPEVDSRQNSICSVPSKRYPSTEPLIRPPPRPRSHLGFVPEIVVTEHQLFLVSPPAHSPRTRRRPSHLSRQDSECSYNSGCFSAAMSEDIVFEFPDSSSGSQNDSPPYDMP
ncbi:unnamed protein product [Caenorhabditis auriculariae]|uniref:Transmembrane protein n=1 Tax=Caenorhabditis auriculariae TaxID=2777116 RepID=A0A8S1HFC3_9PELO|nr:unnamed protein product [Caenorhabditis auriculariae]